MDYTVSSGEISTGIILSYDSMFISSGGVANSTTINSRGYMQISSGGTANSTTINDYGNMYIYSGGTANSTTINSRGAMYISSGGTVDSTTINSGGSIYISSGGTANNTTINGGGSMVISYGGTATNIVENGGYVYIADGAYATFTSNTFEGFVLSHGGMTVHKNTIANGTTINSGCFMVISSGGTADSTTINSGGSMWISSGGTANSTTINSSGSMHISSGGTVDSTTINAWGYMDISSGGTATNITANSNAKIGITVASNTYIQGTYNGSAFEMKEAFISGYTINSGGMYIYSGGTANSTTINSGGMHISSGGTANSTTINDYGNMYISSGGVANSTTINSRGSMYISSGGTAANIIENGGYVYVEKGAYAKFASNTIEEFVLSHDGMTVHKNTIANNTTINSGGTMYISSGGVANSTTINSYGDMYISSGGVANSTTLNYWGDMYISSGGTANNTTINSYGYMIISSGGTANGTTINSGGWMDIYSGGMANSTTINYLGSMNISSGGTANSTTINDGGYMYISSGGTHRGSLQLEAGAVVSAYSGATIDFTVADRTSTDDYLITDLSLIKGTPTYTITISENQASGTYKLAQGASNFTGTISIGTEDTIYGSVTVNGADLLYNGITYSADQVIGKLILFIGDITPPEKPVATANTTAFTNQDVTITATYTADSAVKQYKIDDGEWLDYTGEITVAENATIYFRAKDAAGNYSEITEYVVSNIDKIAPDQPTASASITELTNQDVTITATYTADSAVKQYKIGDGEWQDYTGAITVAENATIYFRAKDAAGNYSEITEYVVNNIIKGAIIDGSGMTHAEAVAAGCKLIVTTGGTYSSNFGHDGVEARIEGGTFNCTVSGGDLTASVNDKLWDDREGDTNMTVSGGTFNKVVMGGDRVNKGNSEHIGDLYLTVKGGIFNSQIVGGMAYTAQSLKGQAMLTGNVNMTLAGGTFKSRIYGGCISTENYSTRTAIEGNVNILVDSSENELIFADNVYIVAGSYQCGAIVGNVQVTFTGLGENLKMDADNLVWGGCSSDVYLINGDTRTFQSTISGSRTISFDDFSGKFNTGIRGFNIFTAENGSKLEILASNNLRDIEQWELDWDTQLSGSFQNDFSGDTMAIDLTGWDQTATDLFDCASGSFNGFDAMKEVTLGGETAVYSSELAGYASTNYKLVLNGTKLQLSSVLA